MVANTTGQTLFVTSQCDVWRWFGEVC